MAIDDVTFSEAFSGLTVSVITIGPTTLDGTLEIDFGTSPPTVLSGTLSTGVITINSVPLISPVTFGAPFSVTTSATTPGSYTFSSQATVLVAGFSIPITATVDAPPGLGSGNNTATLSATALGQSATANGSGTYTSISAPCFVEGTHIRTANGEVRVEDLAVGDLVVTASGDLRPIRWLGNRTMRPAGRAAFDVQPVRIAAGAFGAGLPERDLMLSPGHPVLVGGDAEGNGGHLVPIMCLINGTTIERVAVDEVTYWHVELDSHDILLAEGLPAESYLDWGDRGFFVEGSDHRLANPDFVVPGLAGRCRPVAADGPVVEAERARLDLVFTMRLATACAWPAAASGLEM